ncbi:helix-turn-helix domain-containing protein [Nocardia grenadensis]
MGCSARMIAVSLGRSPSTISREIARNGGQNTYRAAVADQLAYQRARRPKPAKLAAHPCGCWWRTSSNLCGRPSRSPGGCAGISLTIR